MTCERPLFDLVQKAQAGDRDAFDHLARQVEPRLDALVRSRMSKEMRAALEPADVLQETLLRAHGAIARFRWDGDDSLLRWLGAIAENVILNVTKRLARRPALRLERDVAAAGASPSKALRREERFDRLEEALRGLSADHRTVIRLSRLEGLPVRDIAARLGRSEAAVKNLLLRALKALRASFGDTESLGLPARRLRRTEEGEP